MASDIYAGTAAPSSEGLHASTALRFLRQRVAGVLRPVRDRDGMVPCTSRPSVRQHLRICRLVQR